jgi:hypothetical protein
MGSLMTKLLEQAFAKARELSEEEQDDIADALFAHLAGDHRRNRLTPEQIADVSRIREDLRSGRTRLATDEETIALWKKCGLRRSATPLTPCSTSPQFTVTSTNVIP